MDGLRFDALARFLGSVSAIDRRQSVLALLGGALGMAAASVLQQAEAKRKKKKRKKKKCKSPQKKCGKKCRNVLTDPQNCGRCAFLCEGLPCVEGQCGCPPGQHVCEDPSGSGEYVCCNYGEPCVQGECLAACPAETPETCQPFGATCGLAPLSVCECVHSVDGVTRCNAADFVSCVEPCERDADCLEILGEPGLCIANQHCCGLRPTACVPIVDCVIPE